MIGAACFVPTAVKGLSLVPASPTPPSGAELLNSDRMLMRQLLEEFDHVAIDSPPILGFADAPLLSHAAEGCVFVVEAEGAAVRGIKASPDGPSPFMHMCLAWCLSS